MEFQRTLGWNTRRGSGPGIQCPLSFLSKYPPTTPGQKKASKQTLPDNIFIKMIPILVSFPCLFPQYAISQYSIAFQTLHHPSVNTYSPRHAFSRITPASSKPHIGGCISWGGPCHIPSVQRSACICVLHGDSKEQERQEANYCDLIPLSAHFRRSRMSQPARDSS